MIESYHTNYNALTESTKGSVSNNQIMWGAIALTIYESIESWVEPNSPKRLGQTLIPKGIIGSAGVEPTSQMFVI